MRKERTHRYGEHFRKRYLSIIAACSSGADEGSLNEKTIPHVDLRVPYGKQGTILLREQGVCDVLDEARDPTETRAWCSQESLLSRQCLVYSSLYMFWCCQKVAYKKSGHSAIH